MTIRAILMGFVGALLLGAGGQYASKYVPGMWGLVRGHLPVSVFGFLILLVLVINPLIGRIRSAWRLRGAELALMAAMMLVACGITDAGMMRYFPRQLAHPMILNRTNPGWQRAKVLEFAPPAMFANNGKDGEVIQNYAVAMGTKDKIMPFSSVPWQAWSKPLWLWTGIIMFTMVAVISLAVLVHRQWADKERIRYPLAEIVSSLVRIDDKGGVAIFRSSVFWIGLGVVLFIRIVNGIYLWFPNSIEIPLTFDFSAIQAAFPSFMKTPGASNFAFPTLYPACIGFTYMLSTEIGFSLGMSSVLSVFAFYLLIIFGVDLSGSEMTGGVKEWFSFGAFLAMGLLLVFLGRQTYWLTLKEAITFRKQKEVEPSGVWALRCLILSIASVVALLAVAGMTPIFAFFGLCLILLLFLVSTRMNTECGVFMFSPMWAMPGVMMGIFGSEALGPTLIICLGMMRYLVQADSFECMMPFASNGLKMTSDAGVKLGKAALILMAVIIVTIAVAVPTALWADYNNGAALRRGNTSAEVFNAAQMSITRLDLTGDLNKVNAYGGWQRIINSRPDDQFLVAAGAGFGLLVLFSMLRLRYTWWPFHPVFLLGFGIGGKFGVSFLVGCLIKVLVTRFGVANQYSKVKPLMIGVIVGDLAGGFIFMIVSWIYYAVTGMAGASMLLW